MSVLTVEEFLNKIKERTDGKTDDETLAFIEDATDTLKDLKCDGIDWKAKYDENDKMWRDKYKERFFSQSGDSDSDENKSGGNEDEPEFKESFEDLFKTGE